MDRYVERVCAEIRSSHAWAGALQADLPERVDTVFFGGGTPSLLSAGQMRRLFAALRGEFDLSADAEITIECAPGQLEDETLEAMLRLGMNRISFGVQSFVDAEAHAVGRLHTRKMCLAEIERMRAAGIEQINVDLIVGLPHQTAASWRESVEVALASRVPHLSLYMLEVDEDSRLGREVLARGTRYGAQSIASEDETAEWYAAACGWLEADGVGQYEISNFARTRQGVTRDGTNNDGAGRSGLGGLDCRSRHNVKYWRREPYVGFGLDAHSMLRVRAEEPGVAESALRWANTSDLEAYLTNGAPEVERVGPEQGFEEAMFLGLRMNQGVDLRALRAEFGEGLTQAAEAALGEVEEAGLVLREDGWVRLTSCGRMVSNEVFSRLLVASH